MFRFASAAFGLTVAIVVTAGAWAASASIRVEGTAPLPSGMYQARSLSVSYDDLDVASADGAAALYQRLEAATHVVCGEKLARHMTDELEKKYAACRANAMSHAVAEVNLPKLTQVAAAK